MKKKTMIVTALLVAVAFLIMGCSASVTTETAATITPHSAGLYGTIDGIPAGQSAQVSFQWGTDTSYGNETPQETRSANGGFSYMVTGLAASTTYHFRAKASNSDGSIYGEDRQFTTSPGTPSTLTSNAPSSITGNSVVLNATLDSLGTAESSAVFFEWGVDSSYGSRTTAQTLSTPGLFSASLSGLDPGTTYHFRAVAAGDGTAFGEDLVFTTLRPVQ